MYFMTCVSDSLVLQAYLRGSYVTGKFLKYATLYNYVFHSLGIEIFVFFIKMPAFVLLLAIAQYGSGKMCFWRESVNPLHTDDCRDSPSFMIHFQ